MFRDLLFAFTPIFVAMNVFGILPLYISLTDEAETKDKIHISILSTIVAFVIGFVFIIAGQSIFKLMGITSDDFKVGGGILLFAIAMSDLMSKDQAARKIVSKDVAIVPISTPLLVGPATLTTLVILQSQVSLVYLIAAFVINLLIALMALLGSDLIARTLGKGGSRALAKISSLLLLAIGVAMVRSGVTSFILAHQ